MISGWLENLVSYSGQILVVVVVAAGLRAMFGVIRPSLVLCYWHLTLVICLALPLLEPWQPGAPGSEFEAGGAFLSSSVAEAGSNGQSSFAWPAVSAILLAIVLLGAIARLAWTLAGLLKLNRIRERAVWLPQSGLPMAASDRDLRARFYLTKELDRPATFGLFEPAIFLPVRALELSEAQLRCVLLHEAEHVRRRHWLFALFEEFLQTLFWFHPAIRWLIGRIRLAREQVIDARVVDSTGRRTAYLGALLEMARAGAGAQLAGASSFLFSHELSERAALIIKETKMSRTRTLLVISVALPALLITATLAVWIFPLHAYAMPFQDQKTDDRIQKTAPVYPAEAKTRGVEGTVVLKVKVDENGKVVKVQPVTGSELLVPAAVDAVKTWTYKPFIKDGKPVPVEKDVTVRFKLDKERQGSMRVEDDKGPGSHGVVGGVPGGTKGGVVGGVPGGVQGGVPGGVQGGVVGGVPGGTTGETSESEPDEHPEILEKTVAEYPAEAKEQHIQGDVIVAVTINEKGELTEAALVGGPEIFKESALACVRQWKWAPAKKDGRPVTSRAKITMNYRLR